MVFCVVIVTIGVLRGEAVSKDLEFRGWPEADKESGFLFVASKKKDAVVVVNKRKALIAVAIPYASVWRFDIESEQALRGESSKYSIALSLVTSDSQSVTAELERVLASLKANEATSVEDSEIIATSGVPVLRYRTLAKHPPEGSKRSNDWQWHYLRVASSDSRWVTLSLSFKQLGMKLNVKDDQAIITVLSATSSSQEIQD
ncbi:MAG: hypothetical protein ACREAA_00780 [Candidatus Polarisedimenticolia bacterium]